MARFTRKDEKRMIRLMGRARGLDPGGPLSKKEQKEAYDLIRRSKIPPESKPYCNLIIMLGGKCARVKIIKVR